MSTNKVYLLKPSGALAIFYFLLTALASGVAWLWLTHLGLKITLLGSCGVWFYYMSRQTIFLKSPKAITALYYTSQQQWYCYDARQIAYEAELSSDSILTPWFILLNFRLTNNRKQRVLVCQDSLSANNFRSLYTLIKWGSMHVAAKGT
jgi:hypothetical protein